MKKIIINITMTAVLIASILGPEILEAISPILCRSIGWACAIPAAAALWQLVKTNNPKFIESL